MKKLRFSWKITGLMLVAFLFLFTLSCSTYQGTTDYSAQGIYNLNDLNGYGDWVYINPYGEVWQPFVVDGWMPFENGHWAFADGNWTWISYEPFGWIVYHYGYWYDDPFYGWVWIPGDGAWSPANVQWLDYGDYICWAPLPPRGVVYGNPWDRDEGRYWQVVKRNDFTKDDIRDYRVTSPLRNENGGRNLVERPPDRKLIERSTGKPIPDVNIKHETVKIPQREFHRMNLPPDEHQRVEQHSSQIRNKVLVPRDEFHQHHVEGNHAERNHREINHGERNHVERNHGERNVSHK